MKFILAHLWTQHSIFLCFALNILHLQTSETGSLGTGASIPMGRHRNTWELTIPLPQIPGWPTPHDWWGSTTAHLLFSECGQYRCNCFFKALLGMMVHLGLHLKSLLCLASLPLRLALLTPLLLIVLPRSIFLIRFSCTWILHPGSASDRCQFKTPKVFNVSLLCGFC